jgi:hypothetical protein
VASTVDDQVEAEESVAAGDEAASTRAEAGSIAFAQLVRAHFDWERSRGTDLEFEARFRSTLEEFEKAEGELKHVYWSTKRPSAVALTIRERGWFMAFVTGGDTINRLHRATDWLARESRIADLMHHADTLAIKVSEVLRGTPERIAMQWLYSVQSHLLGFVERTQGRAGEQEIAALVAAQEQELLQIEDYYARAGEQAARLHYFWGMMVGVVVDGALALALAGLLWATGWFAHAHARGMETFFICYVSGGLGAIISVLTRMSSGNFHLDYEVGRPTIRRLGSFRPFIGAVFGIAVYFLIRSGIPNIDAPTKPYKAFFFFAIFAFLAGFNERWTKILLGDAERTLAASFGKAGESDEKPPGD